MTLPTATFNRNRHRSLEGHLWVFRSELASLDDQTPGALVRVVDKGRLVGIGYHNPASQIAIRLLTREDEPIDAAFWERRLRAAIAYRDRVLPATWTARRLVNSESDLLPGLIIDQYGDHLVVQCTALGIDIRRTEIIAALERLVPARVVVERSDVGARSREGLPPRSQVLRGELLPFQQRIGAATLPLDLLDPHKTGCYLDQQANYGAVAAYVAPGTRVLDACCHLGGFALHAALAGAASVIAIDSAAASCAGARTAATLTGVSERIEVREANAFDELKRLSATGERFDLIVLDPPTFTRTRDAVEGALRGYKELALRALKMLPVDGVLAAFSCSHHVDAVAFEGALLAAAADTRVTLRREARLAASPDHPVLPAVPETEYLKGFVYRVV